MQVGELVKAPNKVDRESDDKCPFCYKQPVGHVTEKKRKEVNEKVTSIPANLKCDKTDSWRAGVAGTRREEGDLPYTLAQHHLISAMQCYAQVRRLVRMGNIAGYDINNSNNGIGLPTTHWQLKYREDGEFKKYGDLTEPGKKWVAFALMEELGAQWHVGHHGFPVTVPKKDRDQWVDKGADESNEDDSSHETQYDVLVVERLLQLIRLEVRNLCDDPKKDDKFKASMDAISAEIKTYLEAFNGKKRGVKPAQSSPFFVSMKAKEFSAADIMARNADRPVRNKPW